MVMLWRLQIQEDVEKEKNEWKGEEANALKQLSALRAQKAAKERELKQSQNKEKSLIEDLRVRAVWALGTGCCGLMCPGEGDSALVSTSCAVLHSSDIDHHSCSLRFRLTQALLFSSIAL